RAAEELADLVLAEKQRPDPRGRVLDAAGGLEGGQLRRLPRAVRQRGGIERQDVGPLLLVEPLLRLLADPSFVDQGGDDRRQLERGALLVAGQLIREIPG